MTGGARVHRGFTLLEVLIALAVVSGALVVVIYSLNYHLSLMERQETITRATLLAEERLREYRGRAPEEGDFSPPYQDFRYRLERRETAIPGVAAVSITVSKGRESVTIRRLTRVAGP